MRLLPFIYLSAIVLGITSESKPIDIVNGTVSHVSAAAVFSKFARVLLVVQYNYAADVQRVCDHYFLHKHVFPNIVIYGSWPVKTVDVLRRKGIPVFTSNMNDGILAYRSMLYALDAFSKHDLEGYLWLHDDMVLNMHNIYPLSINKPWHTLSGKPTERINKPWNERNHGWYWFNRPSGIDAMETILKARSDIRSAIIKCTGNEHTWWVSQSDIFYLPKASVSHFIDIVGAFSKHGLFLELAIPTFMQCFHNHTQSPIHNLRLCTAWGDSLRLDLNYYRACRSEEHDVFHPIKLDIPGAYEFMKEYIKSDR